MKIKYIKAANVSVDDAIRLLEDNTRPFAVDVVNWESYPYKPNVEAQIAYIDDAILLKFNVKEQAVLARTTEPNGEVWTDSCVEFFISPNCNEEYYNFEFNCIGTPLLRHNKDGEVIFASDSIMSSIKTSSTLGNKPFEERKGDFEWSLAVVIPFVSLFKHNIDGVKGKTMKINFYKCGDNLTVPHFVSWTKIDTEQPSFHQPAFFGEVVFE